MQTVGVFHNHNPSNLDSSDQQIRLCWDLNLNPDYESVDLPLEVVVVDQFMPVYTNSRPPLNLFKRITVKPYITNVYDQFDDYL